MYHTSLGHSNKTGGSHHTSLGHSNKNRGSHHTSLGHSNKNRGSYHAALGHWSRKQRDMSYFTRTLEQEETEGAVTLHSDTGAGNRGIFTRISRRCSQNGIRKTFHITGRMSGYPEQDCCMPAHERSHFPTHKQLAVGIVVQQIGFPVQTSAGLVPPNSGCKPISWSKGW